ncbi:MAG: PKD domain-containing protein [Thermoplasmatota archaeon]
MKGPEGAGTCESEASLLPKTIIFTAFIVIMISMNTASFALDRDQPPSRAPGDLYITGWTFPWDRSTVSSLEDWTGIIDDVSPYWYWILPNGTIQATHNETEDPEVLHFCIDNGIGLVPMISNNHNTETVLNLIHNKTFQDKHIQDLLSITRRLLYKGVDINYEEVPAAEKDGFTNFIRNLTGEFHRYGKKVHVSVFPKVAADEDREGPGAYDYEALGVLADRIRVMAYNLHWSTAPTAGPVTSNDWLKTVMGYSTQAIPQSKCLLGIAQYGYNWRVTQKGNTIGVADNVSFPDVAALKKEYNLQRQWNSTSRTPFYEYKDREGYLRSLHYCDAESLMHQLRLVGDMGIGGIAIWKIGLEDPDVSFFLRKAKQNGISDLPPFVNVGGDLSGMRGSDIYFGPVRAYDIETTLETILWDFGDGTTSELLEPEHRYSKGGSYIATLTLSDDNGGTVVKKRNIRIGPYSSFIVEGNMISGEKLTFNGTSSWDLDGIVSYSWNLGDGTYVFHGTPVVNHGFDRPGTYNVTLTVINTRGYTDTSNRFVLIPDVEAPTADSGGDRTLWEGSELVLDARASRDNGDIENYTWYVEGIGEFFGPVVRLYLDEPGTYTGNLKVSDMAGLTDQDPFTITVRDRTPPVLLIDYPSEIVFGEEIEVSIGESYDNVAIENITWNLGEGRMIYGVRVIRFRPLEAGRYFVTVDILDAEGNWNSTTVHIDVNDKQVPRALYHIDPTPRALNETYITDIAPEVSSFFDDLYGVILYNHTYIFSVVNASDDSGISNITWWFGDGDRAGGPVVYHEFVEPGIYRTRLIVEDIWGNEYRENITLLAIVSWNQSVNEIWTYIDVYINNTVYVEPEPEGDEGPVVDLTPWVISISIAVTLLITFLTFWSVIKGFSSRRSSLDGPDGGGDG